jgi:SAM-dependent methyltransferase
VESRSIDRDLAVLIDACAWPSEAFWRLFELEVLRNHEFQEPILEIGCGDGAFTALLGLSIDEAVDLNPRAVQRAQTRSGVYRSVRNMDVGELAEEPKRFATVFANSVLEHVEGIDNALSVCNELLAPGGSLVTTVPLSDMNDHLALRAAGYARMRARQLEHRNLWSLKRWETALKAAGFDQVVAVPYLDARDCRRWDQMDIAGSLGAGRYRVATALRRAGSFLAPKGIKAGVKTRLAVALKRQFLTADHTPSRPSAALLIANKGDH